MRPTHNSCIIIDSYKFNLAPTHTHTHTCHAGEKGHTGAQGVAATEKGVSRAGEGRGRVAGRQAGRLILSFGSTCGPNHLSHLMDRQQVPLTMHPLPQAPLSLSLTYSTHLSLSLLLSLSLCSAHIRNSPCRPVQSSRNCRAQCRAPSWSWSQSRSWVRCVLQALASQSQLPSQSLPLPLCRCLRATLLEWPLGNTNDCSALTFQVGHSCLFIHSHTHRYTHTHSHKLLNNSCC